MSDLILESISLVINLLFMFCMAIMPYVMFFIASALLAALVYSWWKKKSFQEAFGFVIRTILNFLFGKEELHFCPDFLLGNALSEALVPYNKLPVERMCPVCGNYPNTKIPAIRLNLISDTWEEDSFIVSDILEEIFKEEVVKRNFIPARILVEGKHCIKTKYYIYILYAVTENEIKAFDEYNQKLQEYEETKAVGETEQIIDEELEEDLKEVV